MIVSSREIKEIGVENIYMSSSKHFADKQSRKNLIQEIGGSCRVVPSTSPPLIKIAINEDEVNQHKFISEVVTPPPRSLKLKIYPLTPQGQQPAVEDPEMLKSIASISTLKKVPSSGGRGNTPLINNTKNEVKEKLKSRPFIMLEDGVLYSPKDKVSKSCDNIISEKEIRMELIPHIAEGSNPFIPKMKSVNESEVLSFLKSGVCMNGKNIDLKKRRLIVLCRAIFAKPQLLLVNEEGLNFGKGVAANLEVLRKELPKTTIICILKDQNNLLFFKRILFLDAGRIIEKGSPSKLLMNEKSFLHKFLKETDPKTLEKAQAEIAQSSNLSKSANNDASVSDFLRSSSPENQVFSNYNQSNSPSAKLISPRVNNKRKENELRSSIVNLSKNGREEITKQRELIFTSSQSPSLNTNKMDNLEFKMKASKNNGKLKVANEFRSKNEKISNRLARILRYPSRFFNRRPIDHHRFIEDGESKIKEIRGNFEKEGTRAEVTIIRKMNELETKKTSKSIMKDLENEKGKNGSNQIEIFDKVIENNEASISSSESDRNPENCIQWEIDESRKRLPIASKIFKNRHLE